MKKILSLLLPVVFLQSQAFALSGGPVFGNTQASYVGTYAGALIPDFENVTATGTAADSGAAIGLFTFGQPEVGPATGSLVAFVNGAAFIGSIAGIVDPDRGTIRGVIDADSTYNVVVFVPEQNTGENGQTTTTFRREEFDFKATGQLEGRVVLGTASNAFSTVTSASRIIGTASLNTFFQLNNDGSPDFAQSVSFELDGFKQSNQFTGSTVPFTGFEFEGTSN